MPDRIVVRQSKGAFERAYAKRSSVSVEELHSFGMFAVPSKVDGPCDDDSCKGWHMVYRSVWELEVGAGFRKKKDLAYLTIEDYCL